MESLAARPLEFVVEDVFGLEAFGGEDPGDGFDHQRGTAEEGLAGNVGLQVLVDG